MPQFIENILIGIRQWVTGIIDEKSYVIASHINLLYETKADKSDISPVAQSGDINDLSQDLYFVLDCGSSTNNI